MIISGFYHTCSCGNIMSPNPELNPDWKPEICIHQETITVTKELVEQASDDQILEALSRRSDEIVNSHQSYNKGKNKLRKDVKVNLVNGVVVIKLYANHKPFKIGTNHSDVKKATKISLTCTECGAKCVELGE